MSNKFYSIDILNQSNKVTLGVNNGLSADYNLILPNTAPANDQVLAYNASTGLLEWKNRDDSASTGNSTSVIYSASEPTNKTDGLIWVEINNAEGTIYWEWDSANSIWWSNTKTIDIPIQYNGGVNSPMGRLANYMQPAVERIMFRKIFYIYAISVGHGPANFYELTWRYMNNVAAYIEFGKLDTKLWTNPLAIYRGDFSITAANTMGSGRYRFQNHVFSFEFLINSTTDTGVCRPYGTSRVVFRHERKAPLAG